MNSQSVLMTIAEVQRETQLGRTKVYELIRNGELPVIRIGRAVRIRREVLDAWLLTLEERSGTRPWAR